MAKKLFIMTPFAPVLGAYLIKPDKAYKDQKHDMFKVRLDPSEADLKKFQAELAKIAKDFTFKVKAPKLGISVAKADGKITLCPTSRFKPAVFDTKNNKLEDPRVGAGTILRAYCQLNVHDEGIGLQLVQVQIMELKEWTSAAQSSAFGEEDGYVAGEGSSFGGEASDEGDTQKDVDALGI